jgi:hypothetical protein
MTAVSALLTTRLTMMEMGAEKSHKGRGKAGGRWSQTEGDPEETEVQDGDMPRSELQHHREEERREEYREHDNEATGHNPSVDTRGNGHSREREERIELSIHRLLAKVRGDQSTREREVDNQHDGNHL